MASTSRLLWSTWGIALPFLFIGCGGGNRVATKTPDSVAQPDFSVTMPASVIVTPNSTQTISISIAGLNGFSGAVNCVALWVTHWGDSLPGDLYFIPG
jgi:hypothetical protein